MSLPSFVNSDTRGLSRLLYQFNDKTLIKALLSSYLKQIDKTQTDTITLLDNRAIDTATNSFLDDIGALLRVEREGDSDEVYRDKIQDRILVNISEGTPSDVLIALKEITEATTVRMFEHYPCNLHLYTNGSDNLDTVASTIRNTVPVCVNDITIIVDDVGGVFTPAELTIIPTTVDPLITNNGDNIIDNNGNFIVTTSTEYVSDINLAIPAELTDGLEDFQVDNGTGLDTFQVDNGTGLDNFQVTSNLVILGSGVPLAEIRRPI